MTSFPIGVFVAITALVISAVHLNQEAHNFWDLVGFLCVLGGTIAVAVITFPWSRRQLIFKSIKSLFVNQERSDNAAVLVSLDFLKRMQSGTVQFEGGQDDLVSQTLRDGAELISLGFDREKIRGILSERILQGYDRSNGIASAFRSLSKYPPAFGLAGTVLGLVTLMREVSNGADAKKTGLMMAIALMATFYGLLASNILVSPSGEHLARQAKEERRRAEIALHAVILFCEGATLLEAQEVLNSYVQPRDRVSIFAAESGAA